MPPPARIEAMGLSLPRDWFAEGCCPVWPARAANITGHALASSRPRCRLPGASGAGRTVIMFGFKMPGVVVAALAMSSACSAIAAEHQPAHQSRHHSGYASLDYGRTPRTMFDGTWNLSANTTAGSCGSYGFRVAVINGRVVSPGVGGVSGRVTPSGNVSVTVRQSSGIVSGAGRLSARSGTGRWTARGAAGRCIGYWQAQRGL
jgi:hypothetical protein